MELTTTRPPLKPLDLARYPELPAAKTKLSPLDLSGIISHPRKDGGPDSPAVGDSEHDKLVATARKWVAQTFFGTMLKQMRQSPFRSELFEGGRGGQAFGQLYDQKMVEHMSRGAGNKLVQSLVRKLEARKAYGKQHVADAESARNAAVQPPSPAGTGAGEMGRRTSDAQPAMFQKPGVSPNTRSHVTAAR